jgi:hypothetical protein
VIFKAALQKTVVYNTVKSAHAVTSIKQSSALKGHLFLPCHSDSTLKIATCHYQFELNPILRDCSLLAEE